MSGFRPERPESRPSPTGRARRPLALLAGLALLATAAARADEFDRLEGEALTGVPASPDATRRDRLTVGDLGGLPNVLAGVRSAPIVVETDRGNLARLLVAPALRRPPGGDGDPLPILVLERFETFESPRATTRLARGRDLLLFDGFRLDLDSGQVVPEGQGGDLQFLTGGEGGPRLVPLGKSTLYTLSKSPLKAAEPSKGPSPGRVVVPADFAGRYRFFGNGQWSGTLELKTDGRDVTGSFRSDQTGTSYRVTGSVAADSPQKLFFEIQFPRSRLGGTGYLWTEGKGAMAGTVSLLDHEFGFFALREGGRVTAGGDESEPPGVEEDRREVRLQADGRLVCDGKPTDPAALAETIKAGPTAGVLLRVPTDLPYGVVAKALESLRAAGVADLRIAPETEARP